MRKPKTHKSSAAAGLIYLMEKEKGISDKQAVKNTETRMIQAKERILGALKRIKEKEGKTK